MQFRCDKVLWTFHGLVSDPAAWIRWNRFWSFDSGLLFQ